MPGTPQQVVVPLVVLSSHNTQRQQNNIQNPKVEPIVYEPDTNVQVTNEQVVEEAQ